MLTGILFIIIGAWLEAPVWYFVLCESVVLAKFIGYGIDMYKAGRDE